MTFKVGDTVYIKSLDGISKTLVDGQNDECLFVTDRMSHLCGKWSKIVRVIDEDDWYRLRLDGCDMSWTKDWVCRRVKSTKIAKRMYQGRIIKEEEGWLWLD